MATTDCHYEAVHQIAASFVARDDRFSVLALIIDWTIYLGAVVSAIVADEIWLKLPAAVIAGTAISMLFILGHDAAHKSLVSSQAANAILGRILFLPCLHNYSLWVIQHNRLHHQATNIRNLNSYSPRSPEEFQDMPPWRQWRERLYRSFAGFGLYYLIERWWKDKFFPRKHLSRKSRSSAWLDFVVVISWPVCFAVALYAILGGGDAFAPAMLWGFVVPFLVWNQLMGLTAFLQHTNPKVPWFRSLEESRGNKTQAELTVLVQYPSWYDVLSHNIMQHQAHHINARIPWYKLKAAQHKFTELLGDSVATERMSLRYVLRLTRMCQLYDYERNRWLSFAGQPTYEEKPLPLTAVAS